MCAKFMDVSPKDERLMDIAMEIVKDAAMRSILSPGTVEQKESYIRKRAEDVAELAAGAARTTADAMVDLLKTGVLSRLPLQETSEDRRSRFRQCFPVGIEPSSTQAEDEPKQ